jgi:TRAP-type C4-dicarboxylate transport system substrate-binding protein
MSLHFLFRSEDHLIKAIGRSRLFEAIKAMIDDTVQGSACDRARHARPAHMYSKKEIHKSRTSRASRCACRPPPTEDTMFPAYGAQTVHMPFGSVYTSLQTGVMDVAENGVNVYLANKHYEVAPVLSMTEHEANNSLIWVSDKLWQQPDAEQKGWVQAAADEVNQEAGQGDRARAPVAASSRAIGVKVVDDVDKSGFIKIADPYLDKLAKELGPHAEKIKNLIRRDQWECRHSAKAGHHDGGCAGEWVPALTGR